jgi:hypothetical protein
MTREPACGQSPSDVVSAPNPSTNDGQRERSYQTPSAALTA